MHGMLSNLVADHESVIRQLRKDLAVYAEAIFSPG